MGDLYVPLSPSTTAVYLSKIIAAMIWAWDCGLTLTFWQPHDPAAALLYNCDLVRIPWWRADDITVKWKPFMKSWCFSESVYALLHPHHHCANQDVRLLFPLEAESSKSIVISSCEQHVLWSWARILPAFPPCLPWERPPSTCDLLHIWTVSSQLPQHFDHILMNHLTTPSPRGRKESQAGVCWTHTRIK